MARFRRFRVTFKNGKLSEFSVFDRKTALRIGALNTFMDMTPDTMGCYLATVLTQDERIELYEAFREAMATAVVRGEDRPHKLD